MEVPDKVKHFFINPKTTFLKIQIYVYFYQIVFLTSLPGGGGGGGGVLPYMGDIGTCRGIGYGF